jgi:RNA 3'-terminal phosphate cyclase (ATP)
MQVVIDGSFGEGGGQILRTSLALSLVTGRPISILNLRAGRKKPGLMRQHLAAVHAAATIGRADVHGNEIGSQQLSFSPTSIKPGDYRFSVGTAGSATLVFQTVLPALLTADRQSSLTMEGGTHNPFAPPFDFLTRTFLPAIGRMGGTVTAHLDRPGFFPVGGGRFHATINPAGIAPGFNLCDRGAILRRSARALVSRLPRKIAERELKTVQHELNIDPNQLRIEEIENSPGPGNVLIVEIEAEHITEVFVAFGQRGVPAERVAWEVVKEVQEYLNTKAPAGKYLADQLILPLALTGGGRFRTVQPTLHTKTNIEVVKRFLPVDIAVTRLDGNIWEIEIKQL